MDNMGDILSDIWIFILGAVLLFIVPTMILFLFSDNITQDYIETKTIEFTDTARTTGKITASEYDNFIKELDKTGYVYDISITHITNNAIPEYDDDNNFTGKIIEGTATYIESDILDVLYNKSEDYCMSLNDSIQVTVVCRNETYGAKIYKLFMRTETPKLCYNYGGFVANNPQV